jgi:hypothetical protein
MSSKVVATLILFAGALCCGALHAQSNPADAPAEGAPPSAALSDPAATPVAPAAATAPADSAADPAPPPRFFAQLAPYGRWVSGEARGWTWVPTAVPAGWKPYTVGHWEVTSYGWTWMSDEPFGWATYHYGRWFMDDKLGWTWLPGDDFGAAWVDWRAGHGYTGWAPLQPDPDAKPPAEQYCFVKDGALLAPSLADAFQPAEYDARLRAHTTPIVAPPLPDAPPPPPSRWARIWPYLSTFLEVVSDVANAVPSGTHAGAAHLSPPPVSPAHPTGPGAQQAPPTPPPAPRIASPAATPQPQADAARPPAP